MHNNAKLTTFCLYDSMGFTNNSALDKKKPGDNNCGQNKKSVDAQSPRLTVWEIEGQSGQTEKIFISSSAAAFILRRRE